MAMVEVLYHDVLRSRGGESQHRYLSFRIPSAVKNTLSNKTIKINVIDIIVKIMTCGQLRISKLKIRHKNHDALLLRWYDRKNVYFIFCVFY